MLVYRDITYIPMTWNDTRMLGLETTWSQAAGLNIKQSLVTSSYAAYKSGKRNANTYSAKIATSPITVNGKVIHNAKEQYPLLSFRNITYFPLTWRFAHDEFGWDYKWNAGSGLSITSHNPQLQTIGLPSYASNNDVALFKGYYYFVETKSGTNHVYRAPVKQPSAKEEIYSYSFEGSDPIWQPEKVSFQIRDNALWFTYHLGGGVSGTDMFVRIGDNGKAVLLHQGYLNFRETPYGTLIVRLGDSAFEGGNLRLSSAGKEKKVGEPGLMYAVTLSGTQWSLGGGNASYIGINGDNAYVLASRDETDANKIYEINLKTNKTKKIVNSGVSWFQAIDNKLYYVKDKDKSLYSSDLDGANEMKLSEHAVSWFDSIDGNLFYTKKKSSTQFELYKVDPNGKDTLVWTTPFASVQVLNKQLVCQLGVGDGVVLLDSSGGLLLKVADPIARIFESDNELLLQNAKNNTLAIIR
ncbi:DUF5050 domain-containing protein [Paenibacillus sp. LHD-117]|uniref:DUF5050 domain-containing protein n=1 Tax=Paenibacillus sp. LHD-117 TaxID=3071412 RepID=UPI0027E00A9A|nr:DUF5050 domain-containing protein [Paenibacillus sp. LHD-117]MDQ6422246.1 DUF5050 domain-containing protein [Paenibacillus sp. LHD-117]